MASIGLRIDGPHSREHVALPLPQCTTRARLGRTCRSARIARISSPGAEQRRQSTAGQARRVTSRHVRPTCPTTSASAVARCERLGSCSREVLSGRGLAVRAPRLCSVNGRGSRTVDGEERVTRALRRRRAAGGVPASATQTTRRPHFAGTKSAPAGAGRAGRPLCRLTPLRRVQCRRLIRAERALTRCRGHVARPSNMSPTCRSPPRKRWRSYRRVLAHTA